MRYFITLIVSVIAAWMTSPMYLASFPSSNRVIVKLIAFLIFFAIISFIVKKRKADEPDPE